VIFFGKIQISLPQLVFVQCASLAVSTLVSWVLARSILALAFNEAWRWMKELWNYGIYVFGTNMSGYLASSVDQLMVGAMLNTGSVASYNISVRILNLVEIPSNSLSAIIFPKSSQLSEIHQKKVLCEIYENSTASILAMLFPAIVFVLLFPSWIVKVLAGDGYSEVSSLAQITILFALFIPFMRQAGTILDSIGRAKLNFIITFLSLILNPVINYFFITAWGLTGAALATLTTYFLLFIVNQFIMRKILGSSLLGIIRKIIPAYKIFLGLILAYGKRK
jgi:O-antigen/teichoic acid export membrane protein